MRAYAAKDDVSALVYLNVANTIAAPFLKEDGNFLTNSAARDVEAEVVRCRLHAEQTGQPILLWLDVASSNILIPLVGARWPRGMSKCTKRLRTR